VSRPAPLVGSGGRSSADKEFARPACNRTILARRHKLGVLCREPSPTDRMTTKEGRCRSTRHDLTPRPNRIDKPSDVRQTNALVVAWKTDTRSILLDCDRAQTRLVPME
jgi:hypothetical protein